VGIELRNDLGEWYRFGYDSGGNRFYSDRTGSGDFTFSEQFAGVHRAERISASRTLRLHLFVDAASIEAFADDGANVLTDTFFPTRPFNAMGLYSVHQPVHLQQGEVHVLDSIWTQ